MHHKPFDQLTASDLQQLVADAQEETATLEFKRQLNLSSSEDKREAAKDVSGMANASGGIIVYGIEEREAGTAKRKAAAKVVPLTETGLLERLDGALANTIVPRATTRLLDVPVPGGHCLLVKVEPSTFDLHMVSGYGEARYYKRTEKGVYPMSEPDVRSAYERIARLQSGAKATIDTVLVEELRDVPEAWLAVLAIPLGAPEDAADPRRITPRLLDDDHLANRNEFADIISPIKPSKAGKEAHLPTDVPTTEANYLIRVRRDGVLHVGTRRHCSENLLPIVIVGHVLNCVIIAGKLWRTLGIRCAPILKVHLDLSENKRVKVGGIQELLSRMPILPKGRYLFTWRGSQSAFADPMLVTREIMDQLWQAMGCERCSWFSPEGQLTHDEVKRYLAL